MKKRIFSGIQPTGSIHIGNYLGAIKNWVELQNDYDCVWCIVDLHALTNPDANNNLQAKIFDLATTYLAAGLDPKKAIIFVQSHVPEHTELAWLLNTVTPIAELERMTQFKEKSKQFKESINMGLFGYPVLMAADILLYKTNCVPVGEDQKQHVELTRMVARKFNARYGRTLTEPECLTYKTTARIMSLVDSGNKMAKSVPNSFLAMNDSPAIIKEKIKRAVTDSGKEIEYSPKKPAIANLMSIYSAFSDLSFSEIEKKFTSKGYGDFKNDLAELVIEKLKPFQAKKKELEKKPAQVKKILENGAKQASKIAKKNLLEIKKKMGLI
ncbi:tryptophan--tRNA ligase [Patescibacteria group bacterium]|nr:tryptophan--tRNA ligase [Patescibacteria group bacterium]